MVSHCKVSPARFTIALPSQLLGVRREQRCSRLMHRCSVNTVRPRRPGEMHVGDALLGLKLGVLSVCKASAPRIAWKGGIA